MGGDGGVLTGYEGLSQQGHGPVWSHPKVPQHRLWYDPGGVSLLPAVGNQVLHEVRLEGAQHVPEEDPLGLVGLGPVRGHVQGEVLDGHGLRPDLLDAQLGPQRHPEVPDLGLSEVSLLVAQELLEEAERAVVLSRQVDVL